MRRPKDIECVALKRALPEFHLKAGDVGTVVHVYPKDAVEVEFMDRYGDPVAILTVLDRDLRILTDSEAERGQSADPLPPGVEAPIGNATKARA
jgi:hypothetical protein